MNYEFDNPWKADDTKMWAFKVKSGVKDTVSQLNHTNFDNTPNSRLTAATPPNILPSELRCNRSVAEGFTLEWCICPFQCFGFVDPRLTWLIASLPAEMAYFWSKWKIKGKWANWCLPLSVEIPFVFAGTNIRPPFEPEIGFFGMTGVWQSGKTTPWYFWSFIKLWAELEKSRLEYLKDGSVGSIEINLIRRNCGDEWLVQEFWRDPMTPRYFTMTTWTSRFRMRQVIAVFIRRGNKE